MLAALHHMDLKQTSAVPHSADKGEQPAWQAQARRASRRKTYKASMQLDLGPSPNLKQETVRRAGGRHGHPAWAE